MDGFDLFKKLGSGAKFDYRRFRSDAERLHILKPKVQQSQERVKQSLKTDADASSDEDDDHEESSDEESESADDMTQAAEEQQASSDSDSDEDSSDSDSEVKEAVKAEAEPEVQMLGSMKASGADTVNPEVLERRKKKKNKVHSAEKLAALKQEQTNHIRKVHRVNALGSDVPHPIDSFEQLGTEYNLHAQILQNIKTAGYERPTPIQVQALPVMLHRREVMACAPTGSGKTAAFILPILHYLKEPRNQGVRALTLAPTRELAKQTYREFQRLSEGMGFKLLYIDKISKDPASLKKTLKKIDILVSTPNRLIYLLQMEPAVISLSSVQWLVVDESDKLFEEGKTGFRDQLATIYKACDGPDVRRAMFSATFAFDVEEWCKLNLDNVIQVYIGVRNAATKTIEQSLLFCGAESGKLLAMRDIIRKTRFHLDAELASAMFQKFLDKRQEAAVYIGIQPPVLVFVQSKERAKDLFHELLYDGMNVDVIHADRTQQQRDNVIKCFRERKIWILICTELMGRGIDFKGVNLVINYDFPNSAIAYIHRIGRTGRAGRQGKAITFFTEDDSVNLRSIASVMITAGCPVPDYMLKMRKPDRHVKKQLAHSAIYRDRISTTANYDIHKANRLKRMIAGTKMKKMHQQGRLPSGRVDNSASHKRPSSRGDNSAGHKRKHPDSDKRDSKKRKHTDSAGTDNNKAKQKTDRPKFDLTKKKFQRDIKFKKQGQKFKQNQQKGKSKGKKMKQSAET